MKVKELPAEQTSAVTVREAPGIKVNEVFYRENDEKYSLHIRYPQIETENKNASRFNLLYRSVANAFYTYAQGEKKKGERYLSLTFKITCMTGKYLSLYTDVLIHTGGTVRRRRKGQIFCAETFRLYKGKQILRKYKIKKKKVIRHIARRLTEAGGSRPLFFIRRRLDLNGVYLTKDSVRFIVQDGLVSDRGTEPLIFAEALTM